MAQPRRTDVDPEFVRNIVLEIYEVILTQKFLLKAKKKKKKRSDFDIIQML